MLKLSAGEQLLLSVVVRETIYNYLGSNITAPVSLVSELDARIGKAASMFEKNLSRVWANKHLTLQVKIRVYVACEISMLLCGCETWPIHRNQKKGSMRSIFAAYNPSLASLDVTLFQIMSFWKELVLKMFSLHIWDISTSLKWPCAQNGRWSSSEVHLIWEAAFCSSTCRSPNWR